LSTPKYNYLIFVETRKKNFISASNFPATLIGIEELRRPGKPGRPLFFNKPFGMHARLRFDDKTAICYV